MLETKLKSKLLRDKNEEVPLIDYTDDEKTYLSNLQKRLARAREIRDQARTEFDGMTYIRYCEENRKLWNSYIKPKETKEESNYQSGTIRQKMSALLAAVNNLELSPDINVFNQNDLKLAQLSQSFEDIIWKTEELDSDREKKLLRQETLFEQGTVFINEDWIEKVGFDKVFTKPFDGKDAEWTRRLKKIFEGASRDIIQNEKVYLGDITQFDMANQPYIFTVEVLPSDVAAQIYGQWDRWKYVDYRRKRFMQSEEGENTLYSSNWLFSQLEDEQVEIIKYQDKPNNEFQIIINSIPMLPLGFPMPWKHGEYSLVKQVFSIISPFFAYGKSFPAVTRLQVAVWDEMLRLMVLKTQKSFKPPKANLTGRVLSSKVLMPGHITHGVDPTKFLDMDPEGSRGLTPSESSALTIIKNNIDEITVNPVATGQNPAGTPTATQIIEVQRQARLVLGLTIFVTSLLEEKLTKLRMANVIEKWFDPIDDSVDEIRNMLVEKFRSFNREVPIDDSGMGQRITRITKNLKTSDDIYAEEEQIEQETGVPTRITELHPDIIKSSKYYFYVNVIAKEKRSSPTAKLLFREFLADLQLFDRPDQGVTIQWPFVAQRYALNWEENPEKLFKQIEPIQQIPGTVQPSEVKTGSPETLRAKVNVNAGAAI